MPGQDTAIIPHITLQPSPTLLNVITAVDGSGYLFELPRINTIRLFLYIFLFFPFLVVHDRDVWNNTGAEHRHYALTGASWSIPRPGFG